MAPMVPLWDDENPRQAYASLCEVYQLATVALTALGDTDIAWLAADRAVHHAQQANDLMLGAASLVRAGRAFLAGGRYADVQRIVQLIHEIEGGGASSGRAVALDRGPDGAHAQLMENAAPEVHAVVGSTMLISALATASKGNAEQAHAAIAAARQHAQRLDEVPDRLRLGLTPTAVDQHAIGVAVELDETAAALVLADSVDVAGLSKPKQAEFWVEVARAYQRHGNLHMAVQLVCRAEELSAGYVSGHWSARALVASIVDQKRVKVPRKLDRLARRIGVV